MSKKILKISQVGGIASVARIVGVKPSAVRAAIDRGVIDAAILGDDETRVVDIESAKRYWATNPKPGRPKPAQTGK